jgi:hypothetical protein
MHRAPIRRPPAALKSKPIRSSRGRSRERSTPPSQRSSSERRSLSPRHVGPSPRHTEDEELGDVDLDEDDDPDDGDDDSSHLKRFVHSHSLLGFFSHHHVSLVRAGKADSHPAYLAGKLVGRWVVMFPVMAPILREGIDRLKHRRETTRQTLHTQR